MHDCNCIYKSVLNNIIPVICAVSVVKTTSPYQVNSVINHCPVIIIVINFDAMSCIPHHVAVY